MPVVKVYQHGLTGGCPPGDNGHERAKRGAVGGWSQSSSRSNLRFLYSVAEGGLHGYGYGCTFTLRDCPPDHAAWNDLRRAFFMRLRRAGMVRAHWVTEWQRRGVPHLHGAIWFADTDQLAAMVAHWLQLAKPYRAGVQGQKVLPLTDSVGWFRYLSKHAARGVKHYQRSPENIPEAWRKTGRMWGHLGDWPTVEPQRAELSIKQWHEWRRILRGLRVADARSVAASGDAKQRRLARLKMPGRVRMARRMLQCPDRALSPVRGVSEWMPAKQQLRILDHVAGVVCIHCEARTQPARLRELGACPQCGVVLQQQKGENAAAKPQTEQNQ